jgi:predicted nucleic acid-binding protein
MIAGIVLDSHSTLATRSLKHFEDIASSVVNPWEKASAAKKL